ncbi:unnamed protein product [Paramecium octaurelia]|uniref:Tubulin-tyrosine ligase family protein n=1 Tax=Paramecium octaurelia TaxID=43137 RepID=A0A8S1UD47_PAROT|nr:unnamed protein product [Paramecium octaurelia]
MRKTHSPQGFQYFMKRRYEQRFPKFKFQEPGETYGLMPRITPSQNLRTEIIQNNSTEQIYPNLKKRIANSQSKEKNDDSCILIGNTLKSLERRVMKPRISYQPEISPSKQVKLRSKSIKKQPKFDGIYYEGEKFCQEQDFQEKYANMRQYYNYVNISNGLFIKPTVNYYKANVSKSNNGQLVKTLLKQRWWWLVVDNDKDNVNFLWESARNDNFIISMPCSEQLDKNDNFNIQQDFLDAQTESHPYAKMLPKNLVIQMNLQEKQIGKLGKLLNYEQCQQFCNNIRIFEITSTTKIHNHIQNNTHLGSKKNLFLNLKKYYELNSLNVFEFLPLTYHIKNKYDLENYVIQNFDTKKIWIVKPGELTNRGHGIQIFQNINEVNMFLKGNHQHRNGSSKTFIVQQYITNPLLYNQRKFDIRCFILFTGINGRQKGYWYQDGYIRTSSKEFNLNNLSNKMIHLTNDAVQKYSEDYGKFEKGNKISFEEFKKYITPEKFNQVYQKMKQIALDQFKAAAELLDPLKRENTFELFGLDFMIDDSYNTWLIETNTNPCLEQTGPLLTGFMPQLIDNLLKLVIDPLYPPPQFYSAKKFVYECLDNKFELIYDSSKLKLNRKNVIIDNEL